MVGKWVPATLCPLNVATHVYYTCICLSVQGKLLVGHNMILDVLHIIEHFITPLPLVRITPALSYTITGLEIEQCSNQHRNLIPDESGPRFAWHTYRYQKPDQKNGVDLWRRFLECVLWVSLSECGWLGHRWVCYSCRLWGPKSVHLGNGRSLLALQRLVSLPVSTRLNCKLLLVRVSL